MHARFCCWCDHSGADQARLSRGRVSCRRGLLARLELMSWIEDFTDGEGIWKKLLATRSVDAFAAEAEALTAWEREKVLLYHAIRDKQSTGE